MNDYFGYLGSEQNDYFDYVAYFLSEPEVPRTRCVTPTLNPIPYMRIL